MAVRQVKMGSMKKRLASILLLPAVSLASALPLLNPDLTLNSNYEEDSTPWEEIASSLPPYPSNENLLLFKVSSATANTFMIDAASLSVGQDQVVRYTIVIESPSGARTVNFEGMRCDPAEYKIYGFGQEKGGWMENKHAAWQPFKRRSLLSYHKALFEDYFCPDNLTIRDAAEGIRNLRETGPGSYIKP